MPLTNTARYNPIQTELAQQRWNARSGYIARDLSPVHYTPDRSGQYYVFDEENLVNKVLVEERAPAGPVPRRSLQLSGDSYSTKQYALGAEVADEDREELGDVWDEDRESIAAVTDDHQYSEEIRVRDMAMDSSIPNATAPELWSDAASKPIDDVKAAREAMRGDTGLLPNTLVLPWYVEQALYQNAQIIDQRTGVLRKDTVSLEDLKIAFKIESILVAGSVANTANEGQTVNVSDIWGSHAWLTHTTPGQSLRNPNAFRTFAYTGKLSGNKSNQGRIGKMGKRRLKVLTWYDQSNYTTKHDIFAYSGEKIVGKKLAFRIEDVL